ncbi:MAG: alpha/beta hydrolase [Deltaproteobacteria bacterium]
MSPLALLIAVVLLLLAAEVLFQIVALKLSLPIFEHRPPISAELYPPDSSAEQVAITTRDGLRLAGSWWRTSHDVPRGVILFCHELDSNRWSALAYCEGLLAAGFHVFTFDFRNHGDSQSLAGYSPLHWATEFEIEDIRAATACIAAHPDLGHLPLGIFGMSRGGTAALVAAAGCEAIRCVAADGALACVEMQGHYTHRWGRLYFPDLVFHWVPMWHQHFTLWLVRTFSELRKRVRYVIAERAAAELRSKPVLLISGARDTYVNPEITQRLHTRTGQPAASLWIVPDAKHNMSRQTCPQEYDARLVEFFAALEPAGSETPFAAVALADGIAADSAPAPSLTATSSYSSAN